MWELDYEEGWAPKNWCFWTVVLEKTLESPLDCKEIQPAHSKGDQSWVFTGRTVMIKLKLQYFGHLMQRVDSLEKTLMLGGIAGRRRRGQQKILIIRHAWMAWRTRWIWVWVNSGSWWYTGRPGVLRFMGLQTVGHDWATELNWTELKLWQQQRQNLPLRQAAVWGRIHQHLALLNFLVTGSHQSLLQRYCMSTEEARECYSAGLSS